MQTIFLCWAHVSIAKLVKQEILLKGHFNDYINLEAI